MLRVALYIVCVDYVTCGTFCYVRHFLLCVALYTMALAYIKRHIQLCALVSQTWHCTQWHNSVLLLYVALYIMCGTEYFVRDTLHNVWPFIHCHPRNCDKVLQFICR